MDRENNFEMATQWQMVRGVASTWDPSPGWPVGVGVVV